MSLATITEMKTLRYIDPTHKQWAFKQLEKISAVVYTHEDDNYFYAKGYLRKATNPAFNYRFKSKERREEYVESWVKRLVEREEAKVAARKERNKGHTLEMDDVLNTSWGYDQTNVDYFQVVGLPSKAFVELRPIASIQVSDCYVKPAVNNFTGKTIKKRVNAAYNSVKIHGSATATPVSKQADGSYSQSYCTPAGMGH